MINLLIKPFYVFVIEVAVQNEVGHDQYGIFFSLFNFCYLFQIFADFGLSNFNNTQVARDSSNASTNVPKILGLKLLLSLIFLLIILVVSFGLNYPKEYYPILWVIAGNQILVSFIIFLRTNISGLGHYRLDSFLSVLDKLILIFLLTYLLYFYQAKDFEFTIQWFVYAQMASLIATLVASIVFLISKTKAALLLPSFDFSLIKQSLPFAFIILTMSAYSRIDGVMLERLLDDNGHEAGIYAASYRILDALNIIGFLFAGLLLPMFSRLIGSKQDVAPILKLSLQLLMAIAIGVALYFSFFGNGFLDSLYPSYADAYYADILNILAWGFLGIAGTHILGTLLTAKHSLKNMNLVFILGFIINVLLNWIYIPAHGGIAAAWSTLVTEVFVALGLLLLVFREFRIPWDIAPLIRLISFGLIVAAGFYLLSSGFDLSWDIALLCSMILCFMVSLLLNIIDIRELKELVTIS